MSHRSYKTELKPTKAQEQRLLQSCGTARFAWNWALNRINEGTSKANAIQLHKELCALKKSEFPWMYNVSKCAPQYALRNLQEAVTRSWAKPTVAERNKKIAKAKTDKEKAVAYDYAKPKFKSRGRRDSFTVDGTIKVSENKIQLPVIGKINLKEHGYLPLGKMTSATVSYRAGRWFVSVMQEVEIQPTQNTSTEVIGVDLGVKTLAVCSNGMVFENPKYLKKAMKRLTRQQRSLSRRVKGSSNRKKQAKLISKTHYKISCKRQDGLHKMTTALVKPKPNAIVIEDLNVKGMMKNHKLAQAISDCGFYEFRRQLTYKCQWNGVELLVIDRLFPSSKTCNRCGSIKEDQTLNDRTYKCECGYEEDRDVNASYNIRDYYIHSQ